MTTLESLLDKVVVECTVELFAGFGLELQASEQIDQPVEFLGVMGFAGDAVRGAIGLAVPPTVAVTCAALVAGAQVKADDWLAEATNQLVGRVKNRLLRWDIVISVALPMVLRGMEVRLSPRLVEPIRAYGFRSGKDSLFVWLDLQITGPVAVGARSDEAAMNEGGVVLF